MLHEVGITPHQKSSWCSTLFQHLPVFIAAQLHMHSNAIRTLGVLRLPPHTLSIRILARLPQILPWVISCHWAAIELCFISTALALQPHVLPHEFLRNPQIWNRCRMTSQVCTSNASKSYDKEKKKISLLKWLNNVFQTRTHNPSLKENYLLPGKI